MTGGWRPKKLMWRARPAILLLAGTLLSLSVPVAALSGLDTDFYNADKQAGKRQPLDTVAVGRELVTAADPRAATAGLAMLKAGGSATDAAIATMIALTVVEPQSSGIGGGAFMVSYLAESGETISIDGRETAPSSATSNRFLDDNGTPLSFREAVPGGLSVGVPGTLALMAKAHEQSGKLPWKDLFQPAIQMARNGVEVSERLHAFTTSRKDMLLRDKAAASVFLDKTGEAHPVGFRLKQPELATTMELLAEQGISAFYDGEIGAAVSRVVGQAFHNPALLTAEDLSNYQAIERASLCRAYRIWTVCSMGPSSSGGLAVLQILAFLEPFNLHQLGNDNLISWHLLAEAMRLAYADREAYGADQDFVDVPVSGLLDGNYLQQRGRLIRVDRAMAEVRAGHPPNMPAPDHSQRLLDIPSTTHLAAADSNGNLVSVTSTIEGPFGSGLMAAGFILNNELTDFDFQPLKAGSAVLNRVEPGKRPRSSMAPTIIYDEHGKPIASFGAAGGATIIAQVAKAIVAHLDWQMPVEAAIAAPQIFATRSGVFYESGTRLEDMAAGLKALGHKEVRAVTLPLKANGLSRQFSGWRGAADPRSEGRAVASGDVE